MALRVRTWERKGGGKEEGKIPKSFRMDGCYQAFLWQRAVWASEEHWSCGAERGGEVRGQRHEGGKP